MDVRHHFLKLRVPAWSIPPRRVTHEDAKRGIKAQEFFLEYQPIVHLTTGRIVAAEALVRWRHPRHGLLGAEQFVSLAEASGAIVPIGRYVLQEACAALARLHRRYPARADFVVHVNVSPRQLAASNFAHDVERVLETTVGLVPECLVLELTESEPAHSDVILRQLARLKGLGVRLALDDFGTAFASLSNLRETTFDLLKVDRSFISGLTHRPIDFKLARTVIELGQMFHLDVVAEGVERYDQVVQLRSLGCKLAQGYFFSRPVSADAIAALIAQDHPRQRRTSRAETA